MKKLVVLIVLLFVYPALAGDYQKYKYSVPEYGSYYKNGQEYQNYSPQYGNTIKPQGDKQQIYRNYVPEYGSYYDKRGQEVCLLFVLSWVPVVILYRR